MGTSNSKATEFAVFSELTSVCKVRFDLEELRMLRSKFESIANGRSHISRDEFQKVLSRGTFSPDSPFVQRLVEVLDDDSNNSIDFKEFVVGLSLFTRGQTEDLLSFSFKCFDLSGDGVISRDELKHVLLTLSTTINNSVRGPLVDTLRNEFASAPTALARASSTSSASASPRAGDDAAAAVASPVRQVREMSSDARAKLEALRLETQPSLAQLRDEVERFVDHVFDEFDVNHDGALQFEEYRELVRSHPIVMSFFKAQHVRAAEPSPAVGASPAPDAPPARTL